MSAQNPYDELPYRSAPIEWSAPERLAVTSLLHGGPRVGLDRYRMLELGCGDGTNLLALAWYRPHAELVGVDGSARHVESARARARELGLDNLTFVHADLREADGLLDGRFEFIVAHGVLSWVPDDARDAVLAIHRTRLADPGLVYVNYNAEPGWSVRGLVRDFLLAQTRDVGGLLARSEACKVVSAQLAEVLARSEHAWSQLMAGELRIVAAAEPSYIAHEYLSPENRPYWRSEFAALADGHGLVIVGDADFDQLGGAADPALDAWLATEAIEGRALKDTSDLLRFRQLHSPLLTRAPWSAVAPSVEEIGELFVASALVPIDDEAGLPKRFQHPRGQTIDVSEGWMRDGLIALQSRWPRGVRVRDVFADVGAAVEDLQLLHRHGLVDLRCVEPGDFASRGAENRLNAIEARERGDVTTAYHRRVVAVRDE